MKGKMGNASIVVTTNLGSFAGTMVNSIAVFKGIRYAEAPSGDLRWKRPIASVPHTGTIEATYFSPACPSVSDEFYGSAGETDEDCLSVNICSPEPNESAKLPVLVWLHGGAFSFGKGSQAIYDGSNLANDGLVVVTCNYRLGALGFLAHPQLSAEYGDSSSGNYGVWDVIEVLKWVRGNISSFGGDRDNITLMGQSSGGIITCALIASPIAHGLFHKAFVASGYSSLDLRTLNSDGPYLKSMHTLGVEYERHVCGGQFACITDFRKASTERLLMHWNKDCSMLGAATVNSLCVDGSILRRSPKDAFCNGDFMRIPLIIGTTADEGSIFALRTGVFDRQSLLRIISTHTLNPDALLRRYADIENEKACGHATEMITTVLLDGASFLASNVTKHGSDSFQYRFARRSPGFLSKGLGVYHGADLRYIFGNLPATKGYDDIDQSVSSQFRKYIANFARSGDPNGKGLVKWPRFNSKDEQWLEIGNSISAVKATNTELRDEIRGAVFAPVQDIVR